MLTLAVAWSPFCCMFMLGRILCRRSVEFQWIFGCRGLFYSGCFVAVVILASLVDALPSRPLGLFLGRCFATIATRSSPRHRCIHVIGCRLEFEVEGSPSCFLTVSFVSVGICR